MKKFLIGLGIVAVVFSLAYAQVVKPVVDGVAYLFRSTSPQGSSTNPTQWWDNTVPDMGAPAISMPDHTKRYIVTSTTASATGSLQGAYNGGPSIAMNSAQGPITETVSRDMGTEIVTQNGIEYVLNNQDLGTYMPNGTSAKIYRNQTPTTSPIGSGYGHPSPSIELQGTVYSLNQGASAVDRVWWYNNPIDNGSDKARMSFAHQTVGNPGIDGEPVNFFNVIWQGSGMGLGETIMNTDSRNMCTYIGSTESEGSRGALAFWCLNGNVFKQGPSLSSTNRWAVGGAGMLPDYDNQMNSGAITNKWAYDYKVKDYIYYDNLGSGNPESATAFGIYANGQPATNNNQQFPPPIQFSSFGWSELAGTYKLVKSFIQQQPVQQTGADPTVDMTFWTRAEIGGVTYTNIRAILSSTSKADANAGGAWRTQHYGNLGDAPTVVAGAAAGASPSISITGGDANAKITLTCGTGCTTGTIATVTFNNPYYAAPRAKCSPADSDAAALATQPYVDDASTSATQYVLKTSTTALADGVSYVWICDSFGY